jgi:hypothetical protein
LGSGWLQLLDGFDFLRSKIVVDLLTVADICNEDSEPRAHLLDSRNKGSTKKKKKKQEDREVNAVDHRNQKQQPANQKEKILFYHFADAEKWCEICRIIGHDLEECKTYLDHKKMPEKLTTRELW